MGFPLLRLGVKDDSPGKLLLGERQLGGLEVVDASQSESESKGFDRCGATGGWEKPPPS